MVGSHGMGHRCPMAPSIFWGSWAAPWLGKLGPAWQWGPRTQVEEGKQGVALPWGLSTDELKSKEDPFGGTGLAGAIPLQVGVGRGVILGWV